MTDYFHPQGAIKTYMASGTDDTAPAQIERLAPLTIAMVHSDPSNFAVILPSDAQIGDIVELNILDTDGLMVFPYSGDTLAGGSLYVEHRQLRKISANGWLPVP